MSFLNSLLFLSLIFPSITSKKTCPKSICNTSSFVVEFPFGIPNQIPQNCTYPGFELSCTKQGLTSLNLPHSGEFLVRSIDYKSQLILIYDSHSCLGKRLLHFDLSNSPFKPFAYTNFTFLTCPTELVKSNYTVIECLSDSRNTTVATTSLTSAHKMSSCAIIGTFKVPLSVIGPDGDDAIWLVINNDIHLTWDVPNCMGCKERGGKCGIIEKSNQVVCTGTGKNNGLRIFKIVSLCIVIPAIACVIAFSFVVCFLNNAAQLARSRAFSAQEIAPQPDNTLDTGLDESTIESYTKVTLGDSMRLPGPGDGTCAICLSEFCVQDMIRVIPECRHCFHATCIDEWLRMKSTCPICRNSPSPAHENVEQG